MSNYQNIFLDNGQLVIQEITEEIINQAIRNFVNAQYWQETCLQ